MTGVQKILRETEEKMNKTVAAVQREFAEVRTGRASTGLVEGLHVSYYGAPTPLKQLATITTPEARLIVIQPWDQAILGEVEKAILASALGITPSNDGKVLRLPIPPLTSERREELARLVKRIAEEGRVSLRTARHEANKEVKKLEKEKLIDEDASFHATEQVQRLTDQHIKQIDELLHAKEHDLRE